MAKVTKNNTVAWSDLDQSLRYAVWNIVSRVSSPEPDRLWAAAEVSQLHSAFLGISADPYAVLYSHDGKYYIETIVILAPGNEDWDLLVERLGAPTAAALVSRSVFTQCPHSADLEYDHNGDPWLDIRSSTQALYWLLDNHGWDDAELRAKVAKEWEHVKGARRACSECITSHGKYTHLRGY